MEGKFIQNKWNMEGQIIHAQMNKFHCDIVEIVKTEPNKTTQVIVITNLQ